MNTCNLTDPQTQVEMEIFSIAREMALMLVQTPTQVDKDIKDI